MRALRLILTGSLAAVALAGCGGTVADRLGMGKRAPDEFQVVRRAPLILPPDYTLRPPAPGAAPAQQQDTAAQAQEILTGRPAAPRTGLQSAGETALVQQSQVVGDPNIREVLVAENQDLVDLDEGRFLFILSWQRRDPQRDEPVIDPVAEAQRLAARGSAMGVITERTGSQPLVR